MQVYETLNVLKQKQAFSQLLDSQNKSLRIQKQMFEKACNDLTEIAQLLHLDTEHDSLRQMTAKIKKKLKRFPKQPPKVKMSKQDAQKLSEFESRAPKALAKWAEYDLEREIQAYYLEILGIDMQAGALREIEVLRSILELAAKAKNA